MGYSHTIIYNIALEWNSGYLYLRATDTAYEKMFIIIKCTYQINETKINFIYLEKENRNNIYNISRVFKEMLNHKDIPFVINKM